MSLGIYVKDRLQRQLKNPVILNSTKLASQISAKGNFNGLAPFE